MRVRDKTGIDKGEIRVLVTPPPSRRTSTRNSPPLPPFPLPIKPLFALPYCPISVSQVSLTAQQNVIGWEWVFYVERVVLIILIMLNRISKRFGTDPTRWGVARSALGRIPLLYSVDPTSISLYWFCPPVLLSLYQFPALGVLPAAGADTWPMKDVLPAIRGLEVMCCCAFFLPDPLVKNIVYGCKGS